MREHSPIFGWPKCANWLWLRLSCSPHLCSLGQAIC
jgi:hypothetical protein